MKHKVNILKSISYVILIVAILIAGYSIYNAGKQGEKINFTDFSAMVKNNEVSAVYTVGSAGGTVKVLKTNSKIDEKKFPKFADFYFSYSYGTAEKISDLVIEYNLKPENAERQISLDETLPQQSLLTKIMPYIYILAFIGAGYFLVKMILNTNKSGMSFGKSKARMSENVKVRFNDVAGADEEKQELEEIVEFLKHPQKFTDVGARIPKGVLLVGPPGTGKTLLAKAVAGESNVPFFSISGSDFVEMYVGVGASRVRDLFDNAKRNMPCIVFIDEIDAVGRQRGTGMGGGNDEREQTLNQLLVEMDGFQANDGIIVLAATNRSDVLDPALLRPGRFDRQVYVHIPDVRGREGIIKIHSRNKQIESNIDFNTIARITSGFTGADIENMLNEAAILAARAGRKKIVMKDLTEGVNKVIMGPQKRSLLVTENDKKITVYHEAGHAIVGKKLKHCDEVQEVSIIPRGHAAGYTMSRNDTDDQHVTYNMLSDRISMIMGGRIAEQIIFGDISTGASNDIMKATEIARKMVTEWGMSKKLGFMNTGSGQEVFLGRDYQSHNIYSEKTASEIDDEIKIILTENYNRAVVIINENLEVLKSMAELLLEKETIYKEEVDMLINGKTKEEVVEFMNVKEREEKEQEEKNKKDFEEKKKLQIVENKLKTANALFTAGVLTKEDLEKVKETTEKEKKEIINSFAKFEKNNKSDKEKSNISDDEEKKITDNKKTKKEPRVKKQSKTEVATDDKVIKKTKKTKNKDNNEDDTNLNKK